MHHDSTGSNVSVVSSPSQSKGAEPAVDCDTLKSVQLQASPVSRAQVQLDHTTGQATPPPEGIKGKTTSSSQDQAKQEITSSTDQRSRKRARRPTTEAVPIPRAPCQSDKFWQHISHLGQGTYGEVFAARNKITNELCALKRLALGPRFIREGFSLMSIREIQILMDCKHQNIIDLKEVIIEHCENDMADEFDATGETCLGPFETFLVLEHFDTDLRELIRSKDNCLDMQDIPHIIFQVASALDYLHTRWYMHRDVKPANILYNFKDRRVVLCDFGMARKLRQPDGRAYTAECITLHFRAPEMLFGSRDYGPPVDIWSLGCVFAELIVGEPFFYGEDWMEQVKFVTGVIGRPGEQTFPQISRLASQARDLMASAPVLSKQDQRASLVRSFANKAALMNKTPPQLSTSCLELISGLLEMNPAERLTAMQTCERVRKLVI